MDFNFDLDSPEDEECMELYFSYLFWLYKTWCTLFKPNENKHITTLKILKKNTLNLIYHSSNLNFETKRDFQKYLVLDRVGEVLFMDCFKIFISIERQIGHS